MEIQIKPFYKCSGKGNCHDSETCFFNTGDREDCQLTTSSNLAANIGAVAAVHKLSMTLLEVQAIFDVKFDAKTNTLLLTEKEK